MILKHLTDEQLIIDTKVLVSKELQCLVDVLTCFIEIENRKLFSEYRYPSMLEFVVNEFGYSLPAASRRIKAARLMNEFPWVGNKIATGSLSITNLHKASNFFRKQEITDTKIKADIISKLENKSYQECEKTLFEITAVPLPPESIRQVSQNHIQIKINLTEETHEKLDNLKAFLGHHMIDDAYFSEVATLARENAERKRFKTTDKGRETHSKTRRPSNHETRTTFKLSDKVCANCGGVFNAQVDHMYSASQGGSSDVENLRLLCFHCNQRARINAKLTIKKGPETGPSVD